MKLSFGNMTLEMNIFNICKQPGDDNEAIPQANQFQPEHGHKRVLQD
jgi:hypothetical protein